MNKSHSSGMPIKLKCLSHKTKNSQNHLFQKIALRLQLTQDTLTKTKI